MKDIIKAYKKQTLLKNTGIVITSLAFAFGIHTFLLDGNIGNYIKANVLEVPESVQNSDIFLSSGSGTISLGNAKAMKDVESISLSLLYDADVTTLSNFTATLSSIDVTVIANEPGLATLILSFSKSESIPKGTELLTLSATKNSEKTAYINVLNANFTDLSGGEYLLSTSGIMY